MIKTLLTLISIFNFCDWVIAFFIAGAAWRIEGKDGRRTSLAVGLAIFFFGFAIVRLFEFANFIAFRENFIEVLRLVPERYTTQSTIISAAKTVTLLFCWFAVSVERRERKGALSGNVARHALLKVFEKLR